LNFLKSLEDFAIFLLGILIFLQREEFALFFDFFTRFSFLFSLKPIYDKIFQLFLSSATRLLRIQEKNLWQKMEKHLLMSMRALWTKSFSSAKDADLFIRLRKFTEARLEHGITVRSA